MARKIPPEAFELWVNLGPKRTYRQVAQHYGVTHHGVRKRATEDGWQKRLAEIEKKADEKRDEHLAETKEQMDDRHLKMCRMVMAKAMKTLMGKEIPDLSDYEASRALDAAIKQERLIRGEPTERQDVEVSGELDLEGRLRKMTQESRSELRVLLEREERLGNLN
jgi:hypothetical protein